MNYFGDAVILCGGKSRRMTYDKAFMKLNDRYVIKIIYEKLLKCFTNVRLCADISDRFNIFDIEVIEDVLKTKAGPAVGIYSALKKSSSKYIFVTACDMPFIDPLHIEHMKGVLKKYGYIHDALIPRIGSFVEPLYAFYSKDLAEVFEEELKNGNYKINEIIGKCNALYLDEKDSKTFNEELLMFTNINYEEDLEKFSCSVK